MRGRLGRLAADNGAHSVGALWAAELLAAGALGQGGGGEGESLRIAKDTAEGLGN